MNNERSEALKGIKRELHRAKIGIKGVTGKDQSMLVKWLQDSVVLLNIIMERNNDHRPCKHFECRPFKKCQNPYAPYTI